MYVDCLATVQVVTFRHSIMIAVGESYGKVQMNVSIRQKDDEHNYRTTEGGKNKGGNDVCVLLA